MVIIIHLKERLYKLDVIYNAVTFKLNSFL